MTKMKSGPASCRYMFVPEKVCDAQKKENLSP